MFNIESFLEFNTRLDISELNSVCCFSVQRSEFVKFESEFELLTVIFNIKWYFENDAEWHFAKFSSKLPTLSLSIKYCFSRFSFHSGKFLIKIYNSAGLGQYFFVESVSFNNL